MLAFMQRLQGEREHPHSATHPELQQFSADAGHGSFKLSLDFDPWRCGTLSLHDLVHEEFLTCDERVVLLSDSI
jgi:hypothetical protein